MFRNKPVLSSCQYCGTQLGQGDMFCPNCGKPVSPQSNAGYGQNARTSTPQGPTEGGSLLQLNEFTMNKKILSVREHYDFQDRSGMFVGQGEGNLIQLPAKFVVYDSSQSELMNIQGKLLSIRHQFTFHDSSGNEIGSIKKKLMKLIGEEYWVEQNGSEFMRVFGNFTEHDYRFEVNKQPVAYVHKKWISVRDSFGVSITGNVDHRLIIGAIVVVEHVEVAERRNRR
jgi:uncharacterized protein YxjI